MRKRKADIGPLRRAASHFFVGVSLIAFVSMPACSTVPPQQDGAKAVTHALARPQATTLGRLVAARARKHDGATGFELVTSGRRAFQSLVALCRLADKTLDLQYYIWRANRTGRILLAELIAAADRGVRVRLLLDDVDLAWKDDELQRLSAHPNVEVRLFNPFLGRESGVFDVLFDFDRITHRMHNKVFIADNSIAAIGGRNVGDRYFSANEQANYRDLDLLAAGPVVRQASASFDNFWNSDWSVPVAKVDRETSADDNITALKLKLKRTLQADKNPYKVTDERAAAWTLVEKTFGRLVWTKQAEVLADDPNKPKTRKSKVLQGVRPLLDGSLQHELLLEMAYLIPGDDGVKKLCQLVHDGIKVRILTNSFRSTDVIMAYAGYRKFREGLVRCGVGLFEMRPDARFVRRDWNWLKPTSTANLHTKAAVLDGEDVLIGSINFDPRSIHLNTEIALIVRSRELAFQVTKFIADGMAPENAYRLDRKDGDLVWIGRDEGKAIRRNDEPGFNSWRALVTMLIAELPIEGQL